MITEFQSIQQYSSSIGLGVTSAMDDLMVYRFEEVSPQAQFNLSTYKNHFYEVSLEINESCSFQIDSFQYPVKGSRLSIIAPSRLQSNNLHDDFRSNSKGYSLFFEADFIGSHLNRRMLQQSYRFLKNDVSPVFNLTEQQLAELTQLFRLIKYEQDQYGNESRTLLVHLIFCLFEKSRVFSLTESEQNQFSPLVQQFMDLCQSSFLHIRSVKEYANHLGVSSKHLSETVKEQTGVTALETIHDAQLNFAKSLLSQSTLTIKEVAYASGFESPEYFCIFFRKRTGLTPTEFRKI